MAERILDRRIPVKREERRGFVARVFDPGLCAYSPHHERVLEALHAAPRRIAGLQITGDYVRGASIEACMGAAREAAAALDIRARRARAPVERSASRTEDAASR
jgi:oxygen-dependent protoporphyrinogen oxidase